MSHVYERAFYHFVWATFNRAPLLQGPLERHAYALIRQQCTKHGAILHALGGTEDHVHLLVTVPRTLSVSDFIESVKGVPSRVLNRTHGNGEQVFRWQGGYGFLTVSNSNVSAVVGYIANQKQHHAEGSLWHSAEKTTGEP